MGSKESGQLDLARHAGFESAIYELDKNRTCTDNHYSHRSQRVLWDAWWEGFERGWIGYAEIVRGNSRAKGERP